MNNLEVNMIYKYELACKEAGLDEENIVISSLSEVNIEDTSFDLEEIVQHNLDLEKLNICLAELNPDDREFILDIFSGERGVLNKIAREKGIHRTTLVRKRDLIIKEISKKFFE